MPHPTSSTFRARVVLAYVVAAFVSFYAALQLILVHVYGVEVLREGVPESIDRGPGDGFFMFLVPPPALVLWLACVVAIKIVVRRLKVRKG